MVLLGGFSEAELVAYAEAECAAGRLAETAEALVERVRAARDAGVQVNPRGVVEGAAGVAAPILDREGRIVAALNIAGPADRLARDFDRIQSVVCDAAATVSHVLAAAPAAPQKLNDKEQTQ